MFNFEALCKAHNLNSLSLHWGSYGYYVYMHAEDLPNGCLSGDHKATQFEALKSALERVSDQRLRHSLRDAV